LQLLCFRIVYKDGARAFFYGRESTRLLLSMIKCRGQDYFLEGFKGEKENEHRITLTPNSCFII